MAPEQTDPWDSKAMATLMSKGALTQALAIADERLKAEPNHLQAALARCRVLLASGQAAQARDDAAELADRFPGNAWLAVVQCQALTATGEVEAAARLCLSDVLPHPFPNAFAIEQTLALILPALPDNAARREFLTAALPTAKHQQPVLVRLAETSLDTGAMAEGVAYLRAAEDQGPLPSLGVFLRQSIDTLDGNHETALRHAADRVAAAPDSSDPVRRLIRIEAACGRFADARTHLVEALHRWPDVWLLLYRLNRTFIPETAERDVFDMLMARGDPQDQPDLWQVQFASLALRLGETGLAISILGPLVGSDSAGALARPVLAAIQALPESGAARIGRDRSQDVEVVRHPNAQATLVAFGSLTGGLGHLPFSAIDPLLATLPINIVVLRDPYGLAFLRGLPSLDRAGETASIAALRTLLDDLAAPRIVTLGSSIAGYAATRYGLALGADATLSFAGPTDLGGLPGQAEGAARNAVLGMAELKALAGDSADLTPQLEQTGYPLTTVIGDGHDPDLKRAASLQALDHVHIVKLPGVTHHYAGMASVAGGQFLPIVEQACLGAPRTDGT